MPSIAYKSASPRTSDRPSSSSLFTENTGVKTVLSQYTLSVARQDVERQSGGRPRRGSGFKQGQPVFRADRKLGRELDDPGTRRLGLERFPFVQ